MEAATAGVGATAPRAGKVWIDGAVVEAAQARLPVFDRGFLYGDSVFESLRTFDGRPFALPEHLDRLARSAARLGIALPPRPQLVAAVGALLVAMAAGESSLRIIVTRGDGPPGLDPALAGAPRLIVIGLPLALPDPALYEQGAELALVASRRGAAGAVGTIDPQVKSGNYLPSVLAVGEARRRGAHEALLCDAVGRVCEGASSNVFVVRGQRLATPPLSVGLLEGITRRHVIMVARGLGLPVDQLPLWPVDVARADEVFITSSVRGVLPIARLDGQPIGDGRPGPLTRTIAAAYLDAARRLSAPA